MSKHGAEFEKPSVVDDATVREVIRQAGGDPTAAIRHLLSALADAEAAYLSATSLGYRRGRQPKRRRLP